MPQRHRGNKGEIPRQDGDRHWNDEFTNKGTPRIAYSSQKQGEARTDLPQELSETWPCWQLDYGLFVPRTQCFKPQFYSSLLSQHQGTNIIGHISLQ